MILDRRQSVTERRRTTRAPLTVAVVLRVGTTTHLAQACNISAYGMTLRYVGDGTGYLPQTPVSLAFQLPQFEEMIRVRGEVVFDRFEGPYHTTGISFVGVAARYGRLINRYIGGAGEQVSTNSRIDANLRRPRAEPAPRVVRRRKRA